MSFSATKIGVLVAAAVVAMAVGNVCRADANVQYYTVGTFSMGTGMGSTFANSVGGTDTGFPQNSPLGDTSHYATLSSNSNSSVLTFIDSGIQNVDVTTAGHFVNANNFGTFVLFVPNNSSFDPAGYDFSLTIYQLQPSTGNSMLAGTINGSISVSSNNVTGNAGLIISVSNPTLGVGDVTYQINTQTIVALGGATGIEIGASPYSPGQASTINGAVTDDNVGGPSVPLPAEASMGVTMFGLLAAGFAGFKLTRRRQLSA